ncbi:glycosyltransferase [Candidatus Gottesmanbacteria bacterium]|nr:glycosyltransferase [Candidatus Gottesmanbacteria bacterium]
MPEYFFSVIIPILNEEKFLPFLLTDLSRQVFHQFEVIIIDAYSDDDSTVLAEKFRKKLPHLTIVQSKKRNSRYQRNKGVRFAKGNYLVLFEADVRVSPTFLKEVYAAIQEKPADCYATFLEIRSDSPIEQLLICLSNMALVGLQYIRKPFGGGFNTIVLKDAYRKLKGYREDACISDDHDFVTRLYQAGYQYRVLTRPKVIYSLRRFYKQGTIPVMWLYISAAIYFILKGEPQKAENFSYPMGGHLYDKPSRYRYSFLINQVNYYSDRIYRHAQNVNMKINSWYRRYF